MKQFIIVEFHEERIQGTYLVLNWKDIRKCYNSSQVGLQSK
jgi:hypothetical protein